MEQTAVEWLIGQIKGYESDCEIFQIAKEMFEQQIKDAYQTSHISMMTAEQYYNETFKQKP